MTIVEIHSTVTHRSLMHKSKDDLARRVLEMMSWVQRLIDENQRLREQLEATESTLDMERDAIIETLSPSL